jgi:hypothetical protein
MVGRQSNMIERTDALREYDTEKDLFYIEKIKKVCYDLYRKEENTRFIKKYREEEK